MKRKEPKPNKNEGLKKFIEERIKYLRYIKKQEKTTKRQKYILKHSILTLKFLIHEWEKVK